MQELMWLLLPVAAASGWLIAAQDHRRKSREERPTELSPEYFKGLNYLLNEQPDKATDVFIEMLDVDSETVETHLAVGNLFRRRGEVDRAIRIHQNVVERSSLSKEQRTEALLELGRDYTRSGLFDRAEALLLEFADMDRHGEAALELLRDIYQKEREWGKAIEVVQQLQRRVGKDMTVVIAQYNCEMVEEARARRDWDNAWTYLDKALEIDPNCVRASMLQGEMFAEQGEYEKAIEAFKRVEAQDPAFLSEVVDAMLDCYYRLDRPMDMADYLVQLLRRHVDPKLIALASELVREQHGDHDAAIFVANYLAKKPSLRGLVRLVELNLNDSAGELRDTFRVIKNTLDKLLETRPLYKCERCGLAGKTLHWMCPSCKNWATVTPIRSLLAE